MKNFILFVIISVGFQSVATSQVKVDKISVGTNYIINSKVLEQDRNIQVYIPDGYEINPQKPYPVLYVLDGQEYFLHGIAYQDMLRFRDKSPEFIIVGINTERQLRRTLFYKESDKFIAFLDTELIPFIDEEFRTQKEKERIYFGWEMAAGLGLEILGEHKNLFSGFILASPTHKSARMEGLIKLTSDEQSSYPFLLVSAAPEEHWIANDTVFQSAIASSKSWRYTMLDREDHYTTPLKTIHEGLSDYFSDYKPIRLRSVQAYDDYGGLEALRVYYKKRGKRYNLPQDIHKETKHFLILNTIQEDNFKRFEVYMNEFENYIHSNSRDFWLNRYANFYIDHNEIEKALYLFDFGLEKFPESVLLLEGLGDFYKGQDKQEKARRYYKKALEIDPKLESVLKKMEE